MRANALKQPDMVDPASDSSPDLVSPSMLAMAPSPRGPMPLSTFTPDENNRAELLRQRIVSYGLAATLEFAILAAIWVALERQPAPLPDNDGAAIEMVPAPPVPQPTLPLPQKIELPTLKPLQPRAIPRMRLVIDRVLPIPAPQAPPVAQPSPPPPPAPQTPPSHEVVDRFNAEVRAAIQVAIVYPPTARMMKQQGRTRVAFTLIGGHAENSRILQSSGIATIDAAALAAVRDAAYPATPTELAGEPLEFAVFVELDLSMR
jgi:protein TonB